MYTFLLRKRRTFREETEEIESESLDEELDPDMLSVQELKKV